MLYHILKIIVRVAIKIFCRAIIINKPELLKEKGPMLLACNHPNSFLDGVILDTLFEQPLYSLARGDVFKKPFYRRLLHSLNLLPVYRTSEGVENLTINYGTFENCKTIFRKNGIVIIFSEGKCINEWRLRPLKKGTARLAISSWDENILLKVLPVGINYSSFRRFGKNIFLNFGDIIEAKDISCEQPDGARHQAFNNILEQQLKTLVFDIKKKDRTRQQLLLERKPSLPGKVLLSIPALIGFITHYPLYLPVQNFTLKRTDHNDHYDSVLTGILLFAYPLYVIVICISLFLITGYWLTFSLLLLLPFTAWSYVQLKPQLDK
ncbi:MAG: 1-acyl-sn-glycerol-3-phosphate acyltransferase [Chitinophagaceae bacterium]|nr:1-acyl-sn-glycerol-3-phosphate acyltransferase [Chitinophagaceae bacterium]